LNATRSKQYLTTPNYGKSNYPPNMDCYYVVKADTEDRILIEVLDVDMEAQLFRSCLDFCFGRAESQVEGGATHSVRNSASPFMYTLVFRKLLIISRGTYEESFHMAQF
uniref:CUB domain-containing protein n=1 Tax=Haemonchus placei TaxID=6290 RepID=A0A0N4X903_HAEPC